MEETIELQGESYQTKFKIGEVLFFLEDGKIKDSSVDSIRIEIKNTLPHDEVYWFRISDINSTAGWKFVTKKHNEVFISRQDLIDSL